MIDEKLFLGDSAFGERLRFLREKAGLSQTALAQKLGYKRSNSVSNLETGKSPPDIQILQKIASCFNVNLHWLITGKPSQDGESWRSSYAELLRIYHTDAGEWLERLEREIKDLNQEVIKLTHSESKGGPPKTGLLERYREEIAARQSKVDRINDHMKRAFDRYDGVRPERS